MIAKPSTQSWPVRIHGLRHSPQRPYVPGLRRQSSTFGPCVGCLQSRDQFALMQLLFQAATPEV